MPLQTYIDSDTQHIAATVAPDYLKNMNVSGNVECSDGFSPGSALKHTTFVVLAALSSVTNPVIDTHFDTLISTDRVFFHSAGTKNQYRQNETVRADLSALHRYDVKDMSRVAGYLRHNSDLLTFLVKFSDQALQVEGADSLELEFYHDIEEHWEKLYVTIHTQIEDMDQLDTLEDNLYSSFFEPEADMLSGRVVLSVG